jgi:hypothetical protein
LRGVRDNLSKEDNHKKPDAGRIVADYYIIPRSVCPLLDKFSPQPWGDVADVQREEKYKDPANDKPT